MLLTSLPKARWLTVINLSERESKTRATRVRRQQCYLLCHPAHLPTSRPKLALRVDPSEETHLVTSGQ